MGDALAPDSALLDASFTRAPCPQDRADTGIWTSSPTPSRPYVSNKATTFTDAMAVKALRIVFEDLPWSSTTVTP